jgi:uncharacterized damage-inducible protein DinB
MTLSQAATNILNQLAGLVEQIQESDFRKPTETLNGSTIGQHIRHTIEFFLCFEGGYKEGVINYDKRRHDREMEKNKALAVAAIARIILFVTNLDSDDALVLEVGYDLEKDVYISVNTNTTRELVYNIEHAVHHMAIIKIGVREVAPYVKLPPDFGIAASTVRYSSGMVASKT